MNGIITVDIGTTSMRAILYDTDGRSLHVDQRENIPQFFNDGRVEQDPAAWQTIIGAVLGSCAQAAAANGVTPLGVALTAPDNSSVSTCFIAATSGISRPAIPAGIQKTGAAPGMTCPGPLL